jgi:hypothetical protein
MLPKMRLIAFAGGLGAGVKVTRRLHNDPDAGVWGKRLAGTHLRYANLPVGGTLALVAARHVPSRLAPMVRALGVGALLGAVGWGLADPLPEEI